MKMFPNPIDKHTNKLILAIIRTKFVFDIMSLTFHVFFHSKTYCVSFHNGQFPRKNGTKWEFAGIK